MSAVYAIYIFINLSFLADYEVIYILAWASALLVSMTKANARAAIRGTSDSKIPTLLALLAKHINCRIRVSIGNEC